MPSKKKKHNPILFLEIGIILVTVSLVVLGLSSGLFEKLGDGMLTMRAIQDDSEINVLDVKMDGEKIYFLLENELDEYIALDGFGFDGEITWIERSVFAPGEKKHIYINLEKECDTLEHNLKFYYVNEDKGFVSEIESMKIQCV